MPCLSVCSGWGPSVGTRMACCVGSDDQGSQAAADACCALGEQRRNSEPPASLLLTTLPIPDLTQAVWVCAPLVVQEPSIDIAVRDHINASDRQVLLSVFLI